MNIGKIYKITPVDHPDIFTIVEVLRKQDDTVYILKTIFTEVKVKNNSLLLDPNGFRYTKNQDFYTEVEISKKEYPEYFL